MEALTKWGAWIVENTIKGDLAQQLRAVLLLLVVAWVGLHGAWAADKLPGFAGPAKHSDIVEQRTLIDALGLKVSAIELNLMRKDILANQERMCKMILADNKDALRYATQSRSELMTQYREITGDYPQIPTCQELGIQ